MSRITLDSDLLAKLNGLSKPLEICDEEGRIVGLFLPPAVYKKFFYAALASESPFSAEELANMHQESSGRALADFWKELAAE
jgi:hypothetical protein